MRSDDIFFSFSVAKATWQVCLPTGDVVFVLRAGPQESSDDLLAFLSVTFSAALHGFSCLDDCGMKVQKCFADERGTSSSY